MIPLVPNGQNIEVTNENKMSYLNHLAEYRLCNRIEDEIHSFLEGTVYDSIFIQYDHCNAWNILRFKFHHT